MGFVIMGVVGYLVKLSKSRLGNDVVSAGFPAELASRLRFLLREMGMPASSLMGTPCRPRLLTVSALTHLLTNSSHPHQPDSRRRCVIERAAVHNRAIQRGRARHIEEHGELFWRIAG